MDNGVFFLACCEIMCPGSGPADPSDVQERDTRWQQEAGRGGGGAGRKSVEKGACLHPDDGLLRCCRLLSRKLLGVRVQPLLQQRQHQVCPDGGPWVVAGHVDQVHLQVVQHCATLLQLLVCCLKLLANGVEEAAVVVLAIQLPPHVLQEWARGSSRGEGMSAMSMCVDGDAPHTCWGLIGNPIKNRQAAPAS